ncbi:MAG TPA: SpoIIE family protein phosphatase [Ktedonobacterales bacterium]|nr:SpoIIE family protein phosphatase [Ktedonobacterales bacterium]
MATLLDTVQRVRIGRRKPAAQATQKPALERTRQVTPLPITIAPDDPIIAYFVSTPGAVEVDKLHVNSPAVRELRAAGAKLIIPLVSQGELVGLLNLGPRLSQQDYSTDDRRLLDDLATQAAPALRVAQLVREQQAQARARERVDQELRVARLIQQTLLPRDLPALPGWELAAYYQPARAVGGDFYDFLYFEDGRLGIVIGDVTDKGVPAALVMATTRSILRSAAVGASSGRSLSPGAVLERTNDLLHPDIPPKMFVTCLYAILDPATGTLTYANAGHDLPFQRHGDSVCELRATGMPLGLMPGMRYEEKETALGPGDRILFYSDGLVEAHNPEREMFGFPHLAELIGSHGSETPLIDFLLQELAAFTGDGWEQEDDVTLVTLQRAEGYGHSMITNASATSTENPLDDQSWRVLDEWTVQSEPGNERQAIQRLADAVRDLPLADQRLEDLKTAVGEATMNAMEHGNHYQPDLPVAIQVRASQTRVSVRITDEGGHFVLPESQAPDLEAKLEGLQSPRGWGLFLIERLVDEMRVTGDETHHTLELSMSLEGGTNASQNV